MSSKFRIHFSAFLFIFLFVFVCNGLENKQIPERLLCVNTKCSEPISRGIGRIDYFTDNKYGVSFSRGSEIKILGKGTQTKDGALFYIEVNGKRGYAPSSLIAEKTVFKRRQDLITATTFLNTPREDDIKFEQKVLEQNYASSLPAPAADGSDGSIKNKINPKKVEVLDGTTIYMSDTAEATTPYTGHDPTTAPGKVTSTNPMKSHPEYLVSEKSVNIKTAPGNVGTGTINIEKEMSKDDTVKIKEREKIDEQESVNTIESIKSVGDTSHSSIDIGIKKKSNEGGEMESSVDGLTEDNSVKAHESAREKSVQESSDTTTRIDPESSLDGAMPKNTVVQKITEDILDNHTEFLGNISNASISDVETVSTHEAPFGKGNDSQLQLNGNILNVSESDIETVSNHEAPFGKGDDSQLQLNGSVLNVSGSDIETASTHEAPFGKGNDSQLQLDGNPVTEKQEVTDDKMLSISQSEDQFSGKSNIFIDSFSSSLVNDQPETEIVDSIIDKPDQGAIESLDTVVEVGHELKSDLEKNNNELPLSMSSSNLHFTGPENVESEKLNQNIVAEGDEPAQRYAESESIISEHVDSLTNPLEYGVESHSEIPLLSDDQQVHSADLQQPVSIDTKESIANENNIIESWFSFDFSLFTDLFSSSDSQSNLLPVEELHKQSVSEVNDIPAKQDQHCSIDGQDENSCKIFESFIKEMSPQVPSSSDKGGADNWDIVKELITASRTVSLSTDSLIYLVVTAIAVILFSLGYYYIENNRHDGKYVAKINSLERDLLVVKKEAVLLQEKLSSAENQVLSTSDNLTEYTEQIDSLAQELEEVKAAKNELEEQYVILEKEFDAATESGLEMHRLLTESLSTESGSQVLLKTVESLREKLEKQDHEIKELKQLLLEKSEEVEKLHEEIKTNQETRKVLQDKLITLKREKEEELMQLKDANGSLSSQLGDLMEEKSLVELKLTNDIGKLRLVFEETQTSLADGESEIEVLKETVAKLNKKEENLDSLYDTARVASKLINTEKERDMYKEKYVEEEGARKLLEDHVQMTRQEIKSLKDNYEAAEKEKIEALTKLQVLSNYFKEKESQLQKELGSQESMWLQKQSDDHTIYEQMKSLREENEKYKKESQSKALGVTKRKKKKVYGKQQETRRLQNESLKKEICESESSFKIQVANAEQKAHDNWVTSRQMERRLKETQNEATQLRNRLTLVEKHATNSSSDDLKQNLSFGIGESNGDPSSPPPSLSMFPPTTSPPFMMFGGVMPPPPPASSEFLPPPPPPPLGFPEGRPAPVGRISSPPLDHSFSPPPPLPYFYDSAVYSGHHSPSPPPHRPMPKNIRDMGSDQKEPVSPSRYSEHQERPGRRSKR